MTAQQKLDSAIQAQRVAKNAYRESTIKVNKLLIEVARNRTGYSVGDDIPTDCGHTAQIQSFAVVGGKPVAECYRYINGGGLGKRLLKIFI